MQNFGKIKNVFNGILAEGVVSKNDASKLLFKKYVQTIKENDILKTQFLVYNNIENKIDENEFRATEFVKANVNLLKKFDKKAIFEANANLAMPVLFEQGKGESKYDLEKLHEDITTLVFTEASPSTIDTIIEATGNIVTYIKNNKPREIKEAIELPNSMLTTIMVDNYNSSYSVLDESEKKVLKALIDSTDEQKQEVYSSTLKECIELVNEKLKDSDLETKEKLLRVKEKLLNDKQEINEEFFGNISKLVELRTSLKS